MNSLTSEEKFKTLKHLELYDAVMHICDLCPRNEDCDGFLVKTCPFDIQIREVLDHLYDTDLAIQDGIRFAENYEDYCREMEIEINSPYREVA